MGLDATMSPTAPGRVLIVDDDQTMCEAMDLTLAGRDLEVTWRTSAHDAIDLVAEREFDVILTDVSMPTMSGIDLCRRVLVIRPDVPIIVVTGHDSAAVALSAIAAGAYDTLVKPVDAKLLRLTVARALRHRRRRDEG
jgi:DNA-binding NtrC family response regulator